MKMPQSGFCETSSDVSEACGECDWDSHPGYPEDDEEVAASVGRVKQ